ncbi:hypothetical protein [Paenibacillus sp. FSL R7-0652]|uniref:hypothetical protein n=1 Tax=Paenibacillus sp. FSL R7-0652 TaxID=2921687 RepID=UPI00315B3C1D
MSESIHFLHANDLVGSWSSEIFFYDSFEDTQLEFHADGTGCYAYLTPYSQDITLFEWTLIKDRIEFVEHFRVTIEESEQTNGEKYSTYRMDKRYSEKFFKAEGLNIENKEMKVIAFYSPIIEGINSQFFGLKSKTLDKSLKDSAMRYEQDN